MSRRAISFTCIFAFVGVSALICCTEKAVDVEEHTSASDTRAHEKMSDERIQELWLLRGRLLVDW